MAEPEQKVPSFDHALEEDIARLAEQVKTQRERPEMKNASEQELLKEAIRAFPETARAHGAPPLSAPPPAQAASAAQSPLPAYAQNAPAEVKLEIEYLLDMALHHGIGKAVDEAKKSPYFVQDAFHDALTGRLYPELQRRGIVK
jgi:hypothetical protein